MPHRTDIGVTPLHTPIADSFSNPGCTWRQETARNKRQLSSGTDSPLSRTTPQKTHTPLLCDLNGGRGDRLGPWPAPADQAIAQWPVGPAPGGVEGVYWVYGGGGGSEAEKKFVYLKLASKFRPFWIKSGLVAGRASTKTQPSALNQKYQWARGGPPATGIQHHVAAEKTSDVGMRGRPAKRLGPPPPVPMPLPVPYASASACASLCLYLCLCLCLWGCSGAVDTGPG